MEKSLLHLSLSLSSSLFFSFRKFWARRKKCKENFDYPTDVAFKIESQIMREKVAIGKTL